MRLMWRAATAAGLCVVVAIGTSRGQVPAAPAPPIPAAPPGALPPAAPAVAEKAGPFKRLCAGLDECRRKICKTPLGQLLNGATAPLTAATGGVFPPFCPLMPSEKDLAQPGVAGAAAAAQKEALEAKARRDAVRFLGTLDCRYFPDASVQLALALRADSSECVRYEAALVLGRGCCCTELTIKALEASVSGTDIDSHPAERSVRVRCAAAYALDKCLSCYIPPPSDEPIIKGNGGEIPPGGEVGPGVPPPRKLENDENPQSKQKLPPGQRLPSPATIERATKTLNEFNALLAAYQPTMAAQPIGSVAGRQSLFELVQDSAATPAPTAMATYPTPMPGPMPGSPSMMAGPMPAPRTTPTVGMPAPAPVDRVSSAEPVRAPNRPTPTPAPAVIANPVPSAPPALMPSMPQASPVSQPTPAGVSGSSGFAPMPPSPMTPKTAPTAPTTKAAPPMPTTNTAPMMPTTKAPVTPTSSSAAPSRETPKVVSSPMGTAPVQPVAPAVKAPSAPVAPAPMPPATMAPVPPASPVSMVPPSVAPAPFTPVPTTPIAPPAAPPAPTVMKPATPPTPAPTAVKPATAVQPAIVPQPAPSDSALDEVNSWAKKTLQGSTPAERHAAIRQLVRYDWRQYPMVASALLAGAKSDSVDVVRVDCLRHLAAYKVTHPQVLADLAAMVSDPDPWVRQEAATVLNQLKSGQ